MGFRARSAQLVFTVTSLLLCVVISPVACSAPHERSTLLRAERLAVIDPALREVGASIHKIYYASRSGVDDRAIEISGLVIEPSGEPPLGGWPIVSFAHGTTGFGDACAPSNSVDLFGQLPLVLPFVQAGFVVAATDYEGLGTPGAHPYLLPVSAARSVIDAVPAARKLVPAASDRWVAYGYSQGAQAAWAAAELARPADPSFLGAVALAPPTDLSLLIAGTPESPTDATSQVLYIAVLSSLALVHPELQLDHLLSGSALASVPAVQHVCAAEEIPLAPVQDFHPRSSDAEEQVRGWLAEWTLPARRTTVPMFVAAGGRDDGLPVIDIQRAVASACALGTSIDYRIYPEADHSALPGAAAADALRWVSHRFAGHRPHDHCVGQ